MKTRSFLLALFAFTLGSTVAQIGAKAQQQNTITGIWSSQQFGFEMVLMLNPDKTGEFDGIAFTYAVNGNALILTSEGIATTYQFEMKTDQLILSGGDLESNVTFSRTKQNNVASPSTATIDKTPSVRTESLSILGTWSGGGETAEFRSDGQCIISGQTIPYQFNPPWLELNGPNGTVKIESSFTDKDHLNLKVNGNSVMYTRNTNADKSFQGDVNSTASNGQIDNTMVGKWCATNVNSYNQGSSYSSTCITLNADGTYIYVSESERDVNTSSYWAGTNNQGNDTGKWWVQGDRIFYNSPTKGQGSYHFEKRNHPKNVSDPMLVIEGTSYVTAYQKSPW